MNARLARRQAALAGVALVVALGAVALTQIRNDSEATPSPPPIAEVQWESAPVGVFEPPAEPTSCGVTVTQETVGIVHPVLPCGAKILVEYQGRSTQADVVERGPVAGGQAFDLSPALAAALGVSGPTTVRWRFTE